LLHGKTGRRPVVLLSKEMRRAVWKHMNSLSGIINKNLHHLANLGNIFG
jgi:hypothetical protein